jgi:aminopeptidase YwaD
LVIIAACGDDDGSQSPTASPQDTTTPTAEPTTRPTATAVPTAAEDPLAFSGTRAFAIVQHLGDDIGSRAAGSAGETEAAEYMRDELESYGYEATIQEFPFETVTQLDTELVVDVRESPVFATVAMGNSPTGTADGEVIIAGIGRPSDFPENTDGKIALIERRELTFAEKALNAQAAGAAGVIVYNNEDGPFIGLLDAAVSIPVVSMPRLDGQTLANLITASNEPISGRLVVESLTSAGESRNVIAKPPEGECSIIVGGHYDSVANGPGANDNGSGTAVAIELARALAADGELDDVCFVLFGAEEIGLVGSGYYVASLTADERAGIDAMLNFDMLGVGEGWPLSGSSSVLEVAADEAEGLGLDYHLSGLPTNVGSDHASFAAAGIPVAFFNCFCDPRYHTSQDAAAFVEPDRLQEAGDLGMATIEALLNAA